MNAEPLVYVYGDEPFLVDRAVAEIQAEVLGRGDQRMNRQVFEAPGASPGEVGSAAKTVPFLSNRRLVIVKDAHRWSANQWKALIPYLESPNPSTCLVLVAAELDRRLAAGKLLVKAARLVECKRPKEKDMAGWAQRLAGEAGLRLSPSLLHSIVFRVGPDLQLLSQEIEKLRLFAGSGGEVSEADVEALVGDARGTTVFALCDALGQRDLAGSMRALRKLLALSEPPARLLVMIVRHFRQLWIAQELLGRERRPDVGTAAAAMGVPPFAATKALEQARGWGDTGLRDAFERFVRADLALKTGGDREVLEGLILALCDPQKANRPKPKPGRSETARK